MAKEQEDRTLSSENRADTVFYDKYGNEITRNSFTEYEYEEDDADLRHTTSDYVPGGDGSLTPLRQIMQGTVTFTICDQCAEESQRNRRRGRPPIAQFSPSQKVRRCYRCRIAICERHSYISEIDKKIRCRRCNRRHKRRHFWVERILKPLFLRRIDD